MAARNQSHEDFSRSEAPPIGSDRGFGLVFAGFFAIVAAVSAWRSGSWWPYAISVAGIFALLALTAPGLLAPLNRLWAKFGLLLSKIMNPLILGLVFYSTVVPIGLLMRALGKDLLRLKFDRAAKSYWIERQPPGPTPESMRNQF